MTGKQGKRDAPRQVPKARDVRGGIPDRSARPAAWKYVLLVCVFLGWVLFLIWLAAI